MLLQKKYQEESRNKWRYHVGTSIFYRIFSALDTGNSKKLLEQNELSDKIKLKDFLGIQKFDTEKLREIIKVIRVHSQDEIEIEWNFDDIFSEQR